MSRLAATLALLLAGLAPGAVSLAAPPTALKAPTGVVQQTPAPSGMLGLVSELGRGRICDFEACAPDDQICLQRAFETVLRCAREGRVDVSLPTAGQVFRAHAKGYTVYGVTGARQARNERALREIARIVEPSPFASEER